MDALEQRSDVQRNENDTEALDKTERLDMLGFTRKCLNQAIGEYGMLARETSMMRSVPKRQCYSVSMISAITQDRVISNQLIEGGVDSSVFENFIYETLLSIRKDKELGSKDIILLMDNVRFHHNA